MEKFVIQGGVPLSGELTVAGNKNAALPILAACLLTEEELLLHRVPRIRDTEAQIALLERLGVEVAWVADNSVRLWDAASGKQLASFSFKMGVAALAFSRGGSRVASSELDGTIHVHGTK